MIFISICFRNIGFNFLKKEEKGSKKRIDGTISGGVAFSCE